MTFSTDSERHSPAGEPGLSDGAGRGRLLPVPSLVRCRRERAPRTVISSTPTPGPDVTATTVHPPASARPAAVVPRPVRRAAPVVWSAAAIVLLAAPWIDQGLVVCEWVGLAIPLLVIRRLRGWGGESLAVATAIGALAIAFHWTPRVLADSLDTSLGVALLVTAPIILLDALRLAAPFVFAARCGAAPEEAWLPAGLMAVVLEASMPAVFPWRHGYSLIDWYPLIQSADLLGPGITTLVAFAHAGVVVSIVRAGGLPGRNGADGRPPNRVVAAAAFVVCVANLGYGFGAIRHWSARIAAAPAVTVLAVQADPGEPDGIEALETLTLRACAALDTPPDLICWPECSGGSYSDRLESLADPEVVQALSRGPRRGFRPLPSLPCPLLFGGKSFVGHPEKPRSIFQSAFLLDASAGIGGRSHKRHLMPFGEYVPGAAWNPDILRAFPMDEPLTEGTDPTVLCDGGGPRLGVLLCYEDMIPSAARTLVRESANLLVSLVNGAAFTAPLTLRQHRRLAQLRAVESRRFLVRCASTGETCLVSPLGTVVARLPLQKPEVLTCDARLLAEQTLFVRLGDVPFPTVCAALLIPIGLLAPRRGRPRSVAGA